MKVGIIGATGYTGEELLKTLAHHNAVKVEFVTSERQQGVPLSRVFANLPQFNHLVFCSAEESLSKQVDLVFTCLHAGESAKWAGAFYEKGSKVIDLGADFRFRSETVYQTWYKISHPRPDLLKDSVYGLTEWYREDIKKAILVGNPGCYPTSVLLALLPLVKQGMVGSGPIIIDSKSGVSGAGKNPTEATHYIAVNENMAPYKVGRVHRHVGEMEDQLARFGPLPILIFTPHLTPITRGMLSTIYVPCSSKSSKEQIIDVLQNTYADEPFIHVLADAIPHVALAQHTNFCFLGAEYIPESQTAILFSVIDNLGKGASTQAVQNMNLMLGCDEREGLL